MRFLLLSLLVGVLLSCNSSPEPSVIYKIRPVKNDSIALLEVSLTTKTQNNGLTTLVYPNEAWGQEALHNAIDGIEINHPEAKVNLHADSGWVVVSHPKDLKEIELTYQLKQDLKKISTRTTYRPIIQDTYFHVFGHNLLMLPQELSAKADSAFNAVIEWKEFPANYQIHNSFKSGERLQVLEAITANQLGSSIFLGGDFRLHQLDIEGNQVYFAVRGEWQAFTDEAFLEVLEKTIRSQRDFMQDHGQQTFGVSLIPLEQKGGSGYQGTALTNSFAMSATNNENLELDQLVYLLNHEHQHNWIGHSIKNANEEEQYWFSEGFTDYYTIKNIARNHINGHDASYVLTKINEVITTLYTSPVREAPNSEMTYENFWADYNYGILPYKRGSLFAFFIDLKIQQESGGTRSLDDLILKIKKEAQERDQRISHDYIITTFSPYIKNFEQFFKTHIEQGHLMNLKKEFSTLGLTYSPYAEVFDLGFDYDENYIIVDMDPSSKAYKFGLRNGDRIVQSSVVWDDPSYEASVTIVKNGGQQEFHFYPTKSIELCQLEVTTANKEILNL